ncbi:hypothetical protein G9U52_08870 [Paenibacillus sp. S3N08]|uniref:Uncharacterized protein n=1 Tax=Paenibacillus agricola TaxID=2716264 RepID=A0ABX0J293_9BACL|nr:hypothetical protein [Paenibacillus agricola]
MTNIAQTINVLQTDILTVRGYGKIRFIQTLF